MLCRYKLSQNFKPFIRRLFGWCWIDFYSLAWKSHLNISILQLWRAYQNIRDQVWAWFRKLTFRSTKWYMNHTDSLHLSGNIACQNWPIIAKFCTFKPMYWLNQVTKILAVLAKIFRIFSLQNPSLRSGAGEKIWHGNLIFTGGWWPLYKYSIFEVISHMCQNNIIRRFDTNSKHNCFIRLIFALVICFNNTENNQVKSWTRVQSYANISYRYMHTHTQIS